MFLIQENFKLEYRLWSTTTVCQQLSKSNYRVSDIANRKSLFEPANQLAVSEGQEQGPFLSLSFQSLSTIYSQLIHGDILSVFNSKGS